MSFRAEQEQEEEEWPLRREMGEFVWASRKPIGKGTYGQVYLVPDICNPSRPVAIKEMKLRQHMNWKRELAIYKAIRTIPGVIQLRGCIYQRSLIKPTHLVFDLIEKVSPRDLYCQLSLADIRHYLQSLLQSLERLHDLGIVHCDIKPDNILIDPRQNKLTLIDFGHARDSLDSLQLASGIGTMCYNAPEVLLSCKPLFSNKIDVWAAGRVFADMLVPSAATWLWAKDLPGQLWRLSCKYGEGELIRLHKEWGREWVGGEVSSNSHSNSSKRSSSKRSSSLAQGQKRNRHKVYISLQSTSKRNDTKAGHVGYASYSDIIDDNNDNVLRAKSIIIEDDHTKSNAFISSNISDISSNSSNSSSGSGSTSISIGIGNTSSSSSSSSSGSISSRNRNRNRNSSSSSIKFRKGDGKNNWYDFWVSSKWASSVESKRLKKLFRHDIKAMNFALDLLEQLTQLRPEDRPSCKNALKHAFFAKET